MLNNSYISALDIGSSKIAAATAQVKKSRITDIFFETMPSKGIKKGVIVDSIDLVSCVSKALKNLKNKSGIPIKSVSVSVSGQEIITKHSHAVIPLAERGNKIITPSDVEKVNEQARILGSSLEEEIIHQVPCSYTIDSKSGILKPLGLYSHRLEVDLYLICTRLSSLQSMVRVISQSGYDIREVFFSGLMTSKVIFDKNALDGINVLCDIGSDITELLIFEDGVLKEVEILPVGGDDLTAEIAEGLKIPFELAEDIKRSYGMVGDYSQIDEEKEVLVKKDNVYRPIRHKMVAQLVTERAGALCQSINNALSKKINYSRINRFITTGRTVLLEGFLEMLENTIGVSVKTGRISDQELSGLLMKEQSLSSDKYLNYATCLGMIRYELKDRHLPILPMSQSEVEMRHPVVRAINKVKEIYQEYF